MSYAQRTGGDRWKHDPACHGIFIHGGSNTTPKWDSHNCLERRQHCNRFGLTIPTSTKTHKDDSPEMLTLRDLDRSFSEPTFQRILARAIKLRRDHPVLLSCPIYACTDFCYADSHSSGRVLVQLVAPAEITSGLK